MEENVLNKYFKMLEILNLINMNVGYDKIRKIYVDDIYDLLDSIEIILSDNFYLFSVSEQNLKDLYLLFDYYRYTYPKRNQLLINKCNSIIKLLNSKIYEIDSIIRNIENRKFDYNEVVNVCFNRTNLNTNKKYSVLSFTALKKVWESEYYIIKYLLDKELLDINKDYLLNSSFIELGIIHLISFYNFSEEEINKLINLLLQRNDNRKEICKLDIYNIYLKPKEAKCVIQEMIDILKIIKNQKVLKKDK